MSSSILPTILSPQLSLVASGTPQRFFATRLMVNSCLIIAHKDNAGIIYVGTSSATALNTSGEGIDMEARERLMLDYGLNRTISGPFNLYNLWFDGTSNSDKLIVLYTL